MTVSCCFWKEKTIIFFFIHSFMCASSLRCSENVFDWLEKRISLQRLLSIAVVITKIKSYLFNKLNKIYKLFNSQRLLFVYVTQHQWNVRSEQVVHFVAQRRFAQEFRPSNEIANCHMKISITRRPIRYSSEWVSD